MDDDATPKSRVKHQLPKAPTGIRGLDEITGGGLPRGRPTLLCGGAGCGKTLMAMEFLVQGATGFGEPGVFVAFEETAKELAENVRSLGHDLEALQASNMLVVDHVRVEREEIEEMDGYDLEGLFIRLDLAINSIGAKRVVLDTIETLFASFMNQALLRSELRRLFRWLKDKGVTAVITAERGEGSLTRQGLEEYVSDCVILLDHRATEQVSTRRLRIVKYRGTSHGTNEYPFLIDEDGITVVPITSLEVRYDVSEEQISTGISALDEMFSGGGYYRGSTILVSGSAGTGKTSVAAHLALATCRRGEKCLYFAFEEAEQQFLRNMRSIGIDLAPFIRQGVFKFQASRPALQGLEQHLVQMHKLVRREQPSVVIIDPISNFVAAGSLSDASAMLTRLIDFLKMNGITAMLTNLTSGSQLEKTDVKISSIVDSWLLLRNIEQDGERNRAMFVLKSRGMAHSNQLREFVMTDRGIDLVDVYIGSEGVLTGSARALQEARDHSEKLVKRQDVERRQRVLDRKRRALESRIAALRAEFETEEEDLKQLLEADEGLERSIADSRTDIGRRRRSAQGQRGHRETLNDDE
jgi:circadian clock protein KaiC